MKAKLCLKNLFIVSTLILIAFAASSCTLNADPPVYYTITAAEEIENGTVTADKTTAKKGATVTLIPIPDISYRFDSISVKDASNNDIATTEVVSGSEYTFVMPESNVTVIVKFDYIFNETMTALRAGTDGTAGTSGTYVHFGDWPQTIKADFVTVDESQSVTMGANTYYKGSDGAWYAKCIEKAFESGYKYSDGTDVAQESANSTKYFKVEPIKWRVLTNDYNGKKLLLAENILAAHRYAASSNNYKDSEIREWLNGTFLGAAFTSTAQNQIATTNVDNSARSTTPTSDGNANWWSGRNNDYACDNTSDKIFLLSEQEVTNSNYGFDAAYNAFGAGNSRIRMPTDWSKAGGAYQDTTTGYGVFWWLRSPGDYDSDYARYVEDNGYAGCAISVDDDNAGVVPALSIMN